VVEHLRRYEALSTEFRAGLRQRVEDTAGAVGVAMLDALEAGHGALLLPIGLICDIDKPQGALQNIIDGWFFTLEEDILAEGAIAASDAQQLLRRTNDLSEQRLARVTSTSPMFSAALRGYRRAQAESDVAVADGILAWLSGQPNVAAHAKRYAGVKGDLDHFRQSGHPGGVASRLMHTRARCGLAATKPRRS
jgi:hypothetical protein